MYKSTALGNQLPICKSSRKCAQCHKSLAYYSITPGNV